jgi:hypothetical protein
MNDSDNLNRCMLGAGLYKGRTNPLFEACFRVTAVSGKSAPPNPQPILSSDIL